MGRPLIVNRDLSIPANELQFTFARSSGPGGQNVNKVSTKAVLHWAVAESTSLAPSVQKRFLARYSNRINQEGSLVLACDTHREQSRNVVACLNKLREMIVAVLTPPKRRVKTRPSRGAVERRLESKRQKSQRKRQRKYRPDRDG